MVVSEQDNYLSFYGKMHRAEKLTKLMDDKQITRLSMVIILAVGYVMIT